MKLPSELTVVTAEEVAEAFKGAASFAGLDMTPQLLGVLLAQSALETGHWTFMRNYNFGNVKATDHWIYTEGRSFTFFSETPPHAAAPVSENLTKTEVSYWQSRSRPRVDGTGPDMKVVRQLKDREGKLIDSYYCLFWPEHTQTRFRAFKTLEDGAAAFLSKLAGRFKSALPPAAVGDVAKYVQRLSTLGYFTANPQRYTVSVQSLYSRYLPVAQRALLDASKSHAERIVEWLEQHVGVTENPLGSNKGPEVESWLRPCQRDGYGAEFGEFLASAGANWCAAFACAAEEQTRLPSDPSPVHAYRASGFELEQDAKAARAWHDISEVLAGAWRPTAGDKAIYQSGDGSSGQSWRRHVVTVIAGECDSSFRGIGGNENNRVCDISARQYNFPPLLGFIELPRVEEPINVEVLRKRIELSDRLWQGVIGMDCMDGYDALLARAAELDAADPKEDGWHGNG